MARISYVDKNPNRKQVRKLKRATENNGNHTVKSTEASLTGHKFDFKKREGLYVKKEKPLLYPLL